MGDFVSQDARKNLHQEYKFLTASFLPKTCVDRNACRRKNSSVHKGWYAGLAVGIDAIYSAPGLKLVVISHQRLIDHV
jgi:hypothetical protein